MPPRKKELLVSFEDAPNQSLDKPQEAIIVTVEKAAPAPRAARAPRAPRKTVKPVDSTAAAEKAKEVKKAEKEVMAKMVEDAPVEALVAFVDEPESIKIAPSFFTEEKFDKKLRKDTHTKERFFIRNDLNERLEVLALTQAKGFKTQLINYALEKALDEVEKFQG